MTEKRLYTVIMNVLYLEIFLLPIGIKGLFLSVFLFAVCFLGVHIALLTKLGWEGVSKKSNPSTEKTKQEKPASVPSQEPVYYIVEKKTRRARASYSEPKQIHFKSGR